MTFKNCILLFFILAFSVSVFAASSLNDSMIQGDLIVSLNKTEFKPGETLTAQITALSREAIPIAEASIIVELVKGSEFYYPSSLNDNDNVFFEKTIKGINLRNGEAKTLEFSYVIPSNLSSGNYRLDAYFRTERSPIVGITHIFFNPKSASFTVKNPNNNAFFPEIKILRTKTEFNDSENIQTLFGEEPPGIGPIGVPVKPGSTINGKIFLQNSSSIEVKNIEVFAGLCEWDDSLCNEFISQKTTITSIPANSEKRIELQLTAPLKPTAYAIRLEARIDGKTVSIYRNRVVVIGEGARIRKLVSENVELFAGKKANFKVLISPSADHWLKPEFKDFTLKLSVKDESTGIKVFENSQKIPLINYEMNFIEKTFSFTPEKELSNYKVCASIEKASIEFDNYCTVYNSANFSKLSNYSLETTWKRTSNNSKLELSFCTNPENNELKANYMLLSENSTEFIKGEDISGNNCVSKTINVDSKKEYILVVTDYVSGTQKQHQIKLIQSQTPTETENGKIQVFGAIIKENELAIIIEAVLLAIIALILLAAINIISKRKVKKK